MTGEPREIAERLLKELAEAAESFREAVILNMLDDGFPEAESARLCELLAKSPYPLTPFPQTARKALKDD